MEITEKLKKYINEIKEASKKLAVLDCLVSFSIVAEKNIILNRNLIMRVSLK